jgi:hypothetical protein
VDEDEDEDEERRARGEEVRIYPLADEEDEERTARGEEVRIYPLADEEEGEGGHALPPLLVMYPPLLAPWLPKRSLLESQRCRGKRTLLEPRRTRRMRRTSRCRGSRRDCGAVVSRVSLVRLLLPRRRNPSLRPMV